MLDLLNLAINLFVKQKQKGDWGEEAFLKAAELKFDKVFDYRNYDKFKDIQQKGIEYTVEYTVTVNDVRRRSERIHDFFL